MKKVIFFSLIIFTTISAWTQDQDISGELYSKTVEQDIDTSNYYELSSWCARLGLDSGGDSASLKSRLYDYYDVNPSSSDTSEGSQKITIESADSLDYFTIEKIDENYVKIIGDVIVSIEKKNNSGGIEKHKIKADNILFNFKENYLTASGNIEYILEGSKKAENFRGNKLSFNINTGEGIFDEGVTEQNKKIEKDSEKEVTFYFKGDEINKTKENYVLLENGEITSCDFDSPHYKIKAGKIWLLSNDEWAMLNGVLYIGRVPVLYVPAFLHAGDSMIINPSFGFRSDFGYYLQTTTYFIGQKEKDDNSIVSFMQSDSKDNYLKTEGLFLTTDNQPDSFSKAIQDYGRGNKNYIKLMLDYYTTLGLYSAIDLKLTGPGKDGLFSFLSVLKNTKLYISAAKTRKISPGSINYVSLFPNDEGQYTSIWERSWLFGLPVPFRYGLDFSSALDLGIVKMDLLFQIWSDRSYKLDFSNRSENFDFLSILNPDSDSTVKTGSKINSSDWKIDAVLNSPVKLFPPWVNKLNLKTKTGIHWLSKDIKKQNGELYDTVDNFFYPDNSLLPEVSAKITGKILPLPSFGNEKKSSAQNDEKISVSLKAPWEDGENIEKDVSKDENENNIHKAAGDIKIKITDFWTDTKIFSNYLTYDISPYYSNKTQFGSLNWLTPEDIDFSNIDYSFQRISLNSSIRYNARVFQNLFVVDNVISFELKKNQHYNMSNLSQTAYNTYLNEDKQSTETILNNNLKFSTNPFAYSKYFGKINLTYDFYSKLYNYDYSNADTEFIGSFFEPTKDYIRKHSLMLNVPLNFNDFKQNIRISTNLPPFDFSANGTYRLDYWISSSNINTSVEHKNDQWVFKPLTFTETLKFSNIFTISNIIIYDFDNYGFKTNKTTAKLNLLNNNIIFDSNIIYDFSERMLSELKTGLKLFVFDIAFKALYTHDYDFSFASGWVKSSEKQFIPSSVSAGLDVSPETFVFWKNRNKLNFSIKSRVNFDLIRFTESNFNISLNLKFEIFKFLSLKIKSSSRNDAIFRYIPAYCDQLGINQLNIFSDLLKSFNIFDSNDRYESNFNLSTVSIGLIHDMHDWDLNIEYTGRPYVNKEGTYPVYDWESRLKIYMEWKAIPDIKTDIKIDKEDVSF